MTARRRKRYHWGNAPCVYRVRRKGMRVVVTCTTHDQSNVLSPSHARRFVRMLRDEDVIPARFVAGHISRRKRLALARNVEAAVARRRRHGATR